MFDHQIFFRIDIHGEAGILDWDKVNCNDIDANHQIYGSSLYFIKSWRSDRQEILPRQA